MGSFECYYSTLEIEEKASQSEIKNAYRKLAIKHHPDKNKDNEKESKEKFIKIQKAFEILHDPQERSWYDQNKSTLIFNSLDSMAEPLKYRNLFIFDEYDDEERVYGIRIISNIFEGSLVNNDAESVLLLCA
ncbi:hypothetical protein HZS_7791 [Henneguya salminicola]|nr:hypothetical protein HZS_7791 [Henneguya salminicola]